MKDHAEVSPARRTATRNDRHIEDPLAHQARLGEALRLAGVQPKLNRAAGEAAEASRRAGVENRVLAPQVQRTEGGAGRKKADAAGRAELQQELRAALAADPPQRLTMGELQVARALAEPGFRAALQGDSIRYFEYFIATHPEITFETITDAERDLLLMTVPAGKRDELRKTALTASSLFRAVSRMEVSPTSADPAASEAKIDRFRLDEAYKEWTVREAGSVAKLFANYSLPVDVLYQHTPAVPASAANAPLAGWVDWIFKHNVGDEAKIRSLIEDNTWTYACGFGNLYALAVSRGEADPAQPGKTEPTVEGAMRWFEKWTLKQAPEQAMLFMTPKTLPYVLDHGVAKPAKPQLRTAGVLASLSASHSNPAELTPGVALSKGEGGRAALQREIENAWRDVRRGGHDSRIGIVQGKGTESHMYIVFKDIDAIWRTMDIYLSIGDRPVAGLPYNVSFATRIKTIKLVVD